MFRGLELALHERFVDDDLGGDIGEFASLPGFDLLSHGARNSAAEPFKRNQESWDTFST
jgi:hypothetical protein